jgi:hypothetical protein
LRAGQLVERNESQGATLLKGHGFSRAEFEAKIVSALAAEGCLWGFKKTSLRG